MHIFIRHPPLPTMQGRCYGRTDTDLPASALAAAASDLHPQLPHWPIVSSPLLRCIGLAHALVSLDRASPTGLGVGHGAHAASTRSLHIDARLVELDFGRWEDRPWSAIPRADLDAWAGDVTGFRPPDGESFDDVIARVRNTLHALATPHIVVTHAGVIRAAMHLVRGDTPATAAAIEIPYVSVIHP